MVETLNETYNHVQMPEEVVEHDDEEFTREIRVRKSEIDNQRRQNEEYRKQFESAQSRFVVVREKFSTAEE